MRCPTSASTIRGIFRRKLPRAKSATCSGLSLFSSSASSVACRHSENIAEHVADFDIGVFQNFLHAVAFLGPVLQKRSPPCEIPQFADVSRRNKTRLNEPMP